MVKHSYLVTRAQDIPRVLAEAHYVARSGRPGPVVVDVTKTAQTGDMYYSWPQRMILPGYNPTTKAHGRVLSDAAKLFEQSYRPVLYVAAERHVPMPASSCRSWRKSRTLRSSPRCPHAVLCLIPIRRCLACLACMARLPLPVPCSVAICLLRSALVSTIRVTGKLDAFAPGARVIHIDIDPAEIGKNRQPDVPIVGDVATVLKDLIPEIKREQAVHGKPDTSHWWRSSTIGVKSTRSSGMSRPMVRWLRSGHQAAFRPG